MLPSVIGVGLDWSEGAPRCDSAVLPPRLLKNNVSVRSANYFIRVKSRSGSRTHSFLISILTFGFKPRTYMNLCSSSDIESICSISELKRSVYSFTLPTCRSRYKLSREFCSCSIPRSKFACVPSTQSIQIFLLANEPTDLVDLLGTALQLPTVVEPPKKGGYTSPVCTCGAVPARFVR
jgi:hypothetical protein